MAKTIKKPFSHRVEKDGSVTLFLRVMQTSPDSVQYKPYSTTFEPMSAVIVAVGVKAEHVVTLEKDILVLTPAGWYAVAKTVATGAMLAHSAR